eukprot:Blabericola_migrator_1__1019@NODE_1256_length_4964_cov_342_362671_g849_i0_p2_GENE_NODE_1256_length_4964_cov_342_362671_g849_i0NODE_1256_length_4964_cov_342_362671_g849_i0_p2_ORF_typecomplete_len172_score10_47_NODE_1256_length_4964_cov_342_362671_g849_i038814396
MLAHVGNFVAGTSHGVMSTFLSVVHMLLGSVFVSFLLLVALHMRSLILHGVNTVLHLVSSSISHLLGLVSSSAAHLLSLLNNCHCDNVTESSLLSSVCNLNTPHATALTHVRVDTHAMHNRVLRLPPSDQIPPPVTAIQSNTELVSSSRLSTANCMRRRKTLTATQDFYAL